MGRATWSNPFRAARHLPPAVSLEAPVVAAAAASTTTTTAITTATSDNVLLRPVGGVRKKRSKRAAVMSWFGSSFRSALLTAGGGAGGSGTSADATSNSKDRDAPHGLTSVVGATTTAATTTATTTITGSGFGVASLRQQLHHCGNHVAYGASTSPSSTATSFSSTAAPKPSAESNGDAPLPHVHEVNWEGVPETSAAADKDVANSLQTIGTLGNKQVDDEAAMRSASTVDLESGDIHAVNAADVTLTATTTAVEDPARTETRLLARSLLNDYATFYLHPVFKMTYR